MRYFTNLDSDQRIAYHARASCLLQGPSKLEVKNFVFHQERLECKKCVSHISLSHGIEASVTCQIAWRFTDDL